MAISTPTFLYYNGQQILSGQATPFVGRQDSFVKYGSRWADKTTLTLAGQITGCTYDDLVAAQTRLFNVFNKDFQKFEIKENNRTVFDAKYVTVNRVTFPSSPYSYILNYNITLDCYKEDLFSGVYGVLDPSDDWSFEERPDYTVALVHTVSARGFRTDTNGLINARTFVNQRTGLANAVAPAFVNRNQPSLSFCLKDWREVINRFNGSYSIEETYLADAYYGVDGLLRYTSTFDCDTLNGLSKVAIEGNIDACGRNASMESIRSRYSGLNLFNLAYQAFTGAGVTGTLNSGFVANGITEDTFNKKITFTRTYDNNPDPLVYLDYSVTTSLSDNEVTTVGFNGTIKGRGDWNTRWQQVQAFYSGLDPYPYALAAYNALGIPYPLNTIPNNESTSFNQFNAEITVTEDWDNKDLPPVGFKHFDYTLHFTPSFEKVSYSPLSNVCAADSWYVVDLGFKTRCAFSVNGNGLVCAPDTITNGIVYARQFGNAQFINYCPTVKAVLEKKQIGSTTDTINFDFGWSARSPLGLNTSGSYALISTLALK